jgi:hypothetical protein
MEPRWATPPALSVNGAPTMPVAPFRRTAILGIAALVIAGCADTGTTTGPSTESQLDATLTPVGAPALRAAMAAQDRHQEALFAISGVVGTAIGRMPNGRPVIRVFTATPKVKGVPSAIDGVPVVIHHTGLLVALSDPTTRQRPAPLGFSVGHPSITAGTIGARVVDASGNRYVLSNNHVLAASNAGSVGDPCCSRARSTAAPRPTRSERWRHFNRSS